MVGFTDKNVNALLVEVYKIIDKSKVLKESMDEFHEWDTPIEFVVNIVDVVDFLLNLVLAIELAANALNDSFFEITSSAKLTAAVNVIDRVVILPWYLELIDGFLFRVLVSAVVCMMNKWIGKSWNLVVAGQSLESGEDFTKMANRSC